jgi:hypothetical protein
MNFTRLLNASRLLPSFLMGKIKKVSMAMEPTWFRFRLMFRRVHIFVANASRGKRRPVDQRGWFPSIYYINLRERADRRIEVEAELRSQGLEPFQRFDAVPSADGIYGCGTSHLAVLDLAAKLDTEAVMICEDDVKFVVSQGEIQYSLRDFFADPLLDVLCIGNNVTGFILPYSKNFALVSGTQTASCYVVKRRAIRPLTQNFQTSLSKLKRGGWVGKYAFDVYWKRLQRGKLVFAVPTRRMALQRPSFSNIQMKFTDYGV